MPAISMPHSLGFLIWLSALATPAWAVTMPATPATKGVITATYGCDSGETIVAQYDNSDPDARKAMLEYKGQTFPMYSAPSGSGSRYATEQGLSADKGLQWWIKGDTGTLSEMIMDHTAPDPEAIETCKVKQAS